MDPDFAKYDATQLRQVLGTIDAARFPARVEEIKARLAALEQDEPLTLPSPPVPAEQPDSLGTRILRRVGKALVAIGVANVIVAIGVAAVANSSSFSLDVFALIAGIFLWRGGLRAASLVRWLAWLSLPATVAVTLGFLTIQPFDLTWTELRLYPFAALCATALTVGYIVVTLWVMRELGSAPVLAARADAGRPLRDMRIPLALGLAGALAGVGLMVYLLGGARADRAEMMVAAKLGAGYHYHANAMNVMSRNGVTAVNASVVAWNRNAVLTVPVYWKE